MIYPTARSIVLTALGAPAALVIGVMVPQFWYLGLVWVVLVIALTVFDGLSAPGRTQLDIELDKPMAVGVGAPFSVTTRLRFSNARGAPRKVELAQRVDERLEIRGIRRETATLIDGMGEHDSAFTAHRRGPAAIETIWARWKGPLGLAWVQARERFDAVIAVTPNIAPIHDKAIQLFLRDASFGLIAQVERGEGSEFEALTEFQAGMDKRTIDWKQSARHTELLAKEYRTERNNHIVFALDTGRTMCEPLDGLPRVDRAITASLLTAYVALKLGDRASLFGFAGRPLLASPTVSGARAFASLQRAAADLDYMPEESNYTLALTTLASQLHRRSLIIIFTEFADPTSAELMLRAARRLVDRHLVLFVVMRDAELADIAHDAPEEPADVSRAVAASALLRERAIVISKLRRMGADVLEAPHGQIGTRLVDRYMTLKRRSLV